MTGRRTIAPVLDMPEINIGAMTARHVPVAFADLNTFKRFRLAAQPAILLGMDVLGLCDRVVVDFKRREAAFYLPE